VEPPFAPAHVQVHGPEPLTADAAAALHRLAIGAALAYSPLAEPHWPLMVEDASGAEHEAVVPPFDPVQLHVHGPEPLTAEARPVVHRLLLGALLTATPLAEPQAPFVSSEAEQGAVVPPFEPAQLQLKGPLPLTVEAVPALHRLAVGAVVTSVPFALPQAPLTADATLQLGAPSVVVLTGETYLSGAQAWFPKRETVRTNEQALSLAHLDQAARRKKLPGLERG
jgi:hypothetical protein